MATLTEPTVSLSPGYALTAQEITDMYQKLTVGTVGTTNNTTLQSWGTIAQWTTGQWTYVDGTATKNQTRVTN